MSIKYLSPSGLTEVWGNIKTYIASKIPSKIVTGLSIKGRTITYTNSDGTTGTLTTQDTNTTYTVATNSVDGLMSATDKAKLDGIAAGANNYTHPNSHPASMITGLAKVATSGSYNDLTNKPTIPTVNNATLTIQKNGTTVKTFTANASANVTANITVPTKTSELTNNSGFLTSHSPVDSSLSSTSTNAIQNKVVNAALNNKANDSDVVHKSGNETIAGTKTFSSQIKGSVSGTSSDVVVGSDTATKRGYLVNGKLPWYTWEEGSQVIAGSLHLIADFNNLTKPGVYHVVFCLNDGFVYQDNEYKESLNRPSIPDSTTGFRDAILEIKQTTTMGTISSAHRLTQKLTILSGSSKRIYTDLTYHRVCIMYSPINEWTAWKRVARDEEVVHKSGDETIDGTKTFSNVTYLNKELRYRDAKNDWTNTSLDTWCDAGHVVWFDKTGNRRMHELVGTRGGVWRKACYINENIYFSVDSNRNIVYWGYTTFNVDTWFNGTSFLKMTGLESNTTTPTSAQYKYITVVANDGSQVGSIQFCKRADGSFDTTIYSNIGGSNDGTLRISSNNEVYPLNNKTKLGISTAKWSEVWANTFNGNLVGNAATATKATQDANGAVISTTYATKAENNAKANDNSVVHKSGNETINGLKTFSSWQIINMGLNVKWITGNKEQKSLHLFGSMDDKYVGTGSVLELHAEDEKYGMFTLITKDKTNTNVKRFEGWPNGTLTWDGKTILTSGNGVTTNTAQTITGEKTFSKSVHVEALTNYPGHNLWVYTGDPNSTYSRINLRLDGTMALDCVNATTKKSSQMNLKPDGTFTWNGGNVLTDAKGVTLNTAQTISGNKTFTGQTTFIGHNLLVKNPNVDLLHGTDSSWVGAGITGTDKNNVRVGFIDFFIGANDCTFKVFCRNRQDVEKEVFYAGINANGAYGVVDNKHIVRTVNGVGANQAGNVNLTNILGFTPVQQGGGIGQSNSKIYIGWTGSQLKCTVDKTDLGAFVFGGRAQVGTTITAYWGSSSSTGDKWARSSGLNGTGRVSSTSNTFTPVVGQIYSGNQLYSTATPGGGVGTTGNNLGPDPRVVYARLDLSGAFNSSYKYLCTTAVGVNVKATVDVTGSTYYGSAGPNTTITSYSGLTKTLQGGKSTFLRVQ